MPKITGTADDREQAVPVFSAYGVEGAILVAPSPQAAEGGA